MDCIILTGTKSKGPIVKTAGPHRIATELRNAGYSVQVIDISLVNSVMHLMLMLKPFLDDRTLWIGLSNTFMTNFCGTDWLTLEAIDDGKIAEVLSELIREVQKINPRCRFIYGNAGLRKDITKIGFVEFQGFVDREVVRFTDACANNIPHESKIYSKEYDNFTHSTINWQHRDLFMGEKAVPIEISRGCIFRCDFCRFPLNGKKKFDYIKDPDVLVGEFQRNYELFGIKDYIFTDDTFNDSLHKLQTIADIRNRLDFDINFVSYIRLDLVMRFREMAPMLRELGMISATLGIETAVPENAKLIGKNVDFHKQMDFLRELKQNEWKGINVSSGFIVGLPYDSPEKVDWLIDFLEGDDNPLDNYIVSCLQIYPADRYDLTYSSVIDREYESLGYRFERRADTPFEFWINDRTGLDERTLFHRVAQIEAKKRSRCRYTGFEVMDLQNLGIDKQDLLSMTMDEIDERYSVRERIKDHYKEYVRKLMRLDRP